MCWCTRRDPPSTSGSGSIGAFCSSAPTLCSATSALAPPVVTPHDAAHGPESR